MTASRLSALVLTLVVVAGCQSDPQSARGVAERFIDQHYVRIDLAAARPFCVGVALKKVTDEQRLTEGQAIDASTRTPTVRYRLIETQGDPEQPSFLFEGTISVDDAGEFKRKWLISARRDGGTWKVSNFEEFD